MKRPNTIFGLSRVLIQERWSRLSKVARWSIAATPIVAGASILMLAPLHTCAPAQSGNPIASQSVKLSAPPLSCPHRATWDTPASMQGSGMTGELMVQSLPWGRVFVAGRDTGQETPISSLRLSTGRHTLSFMTADCSLSELSIEVAPSEPGDAPQRVVRQLPF